MNTQSKKRRPSSALLLLTSAALSLGITSANAAKQITGEVVGVSDGDTVTILSDGDQIKVRLAEIDAPEKAQAFGTRSKQSLSDMCFRKNAKIETSGKDRYGRFIGRIYCFTPGVKTGIDANAEQIRRGMAWVFDRYVTDRDLYRIQDDARDARRGLWADQSPTPPWEWRKANR